MRIPDTGRSILVLSRASSWVVAYNIAKVQNIPCIASSLKSYLVWKCGMEYRKFSYEMEYGKEDF